MNGIKVAGSQQNQFFLPRVKKPNNKCIKDTFTLITYKVLQIDLSAIWAKRNSNCIKLWKSSCLLPDFSWSRITQPEFDPVYVSSLSCFLSDYLSDNCERNSTRADVWQQRGGGGRSQISPQPEQPTVRRPPSFSCLQLPVLLTFVHTTDCSQNCRCLVNTMM